MPSASAQFQVGTDVTTSPTVTPSIVPSAVNTNSSLNYPTYVPVSVPAPVPSKEAAITNVNMPQVVLPGASFTIIATVTTYIAGNAAYIVNLAIPQLSLNQNSPPLQLSNLAAGSATFNVSLPVTHAGLTASGVVTGTLTLQSSLGGTVDSIPISFNIGGTAQRTPIGVVPAAVQQVPVGPVGVPVIGAVPNYGIPVVRGYQGYVFGSGHGEQRSRRGQTHRRVPPQIAYAYQAQPQPLSTPPPTATPPLPGQTPGAPPAVILANVVGDQLHVDVHGLTPGETSTLNLQVPISNVSRNTPMKADNAGHFSHVYKLSKAPGKQYVAALRVTGHGSNRGGFKTVTI